MFGLTWVSAEGQCRVYVSCVWGGFGVYVFCVFVISGVWPEMGFGCRTTYALCLWGGFGVYVFCVFVISSVLKNQCLAMADSPRFERR